VLVQELDRTALRRLDREAVCAAIRQGILQDQEIDPWAVVLLKPASLPRTTSGKIQRARARELFLAGKLAEVFRWEHPTQALDFHSELPPPESRDSATLARWLQDLVADVAGLAPEAVPLDQALTELGFDSLAGAELAGRIERALQVSLDASELYDHPTLRSPGAPPRRRRGAGGARAGRSPRPCQSLGSRGISLAQ